MYIWRQTSVLAKYNYKNNIKYIMRGFGGLLQLGNTWLIWTSSPNANTWLCRAQIFC